MSRFGALPSWDTEEEETKTVEVRSDTRWKRDNGRDTDIEVRPDLMADFAGVEHDPEWDKQTTTFVAPPPGAPPEYKFSKPSTTDWIGPQGALHGSVPTPEAFDAYAVPPAHDALARCVYDTKPLNSGPTTEYVAPSAPPPYFEPAPAPHFEPAPPAHAFYEPPPIELSQNALIPDPSGQHRASFTSAPATQRALTDGTGPATAYRPKMESFTNTSTWRKTIPALRRMVGLPVLAGFDGRPHHAPLPSDPPPSVTDVEARRFTWPPAVLISMAVGLVAMVVISIVGLGTRAASVANADPERVVTASAPGGQALTRGAVFVDGAERCQALPCTLTLADGAHWVTVKAEGFETPPSRSITVGANEPTDIHFELVPAVPAPAQAQALPEGPIDPAVLPAQPALVDPAKPASEPKSSAARATPRAVGIAKPVAAAPAAGGSRLNINAVPFASVVLDGKPIGQTPRLNVKVKPGAHTVIFITQDGRRVVRGTTVGAGETATVSARL